MQIFFEPVRDRKGATSLVDQAVEAIESAIRQRLLRPGMPVPSIRHFAKAHGLSTFTVSAAYSRLVAQNWLTARPGSGYRVAHTVRHAQTGAAPASWIPPRIGASWLLADIFADHSIPIKSGCGWLPAEWLNEAGLQQSLRQVARTPVNQVAGYGHPYGYHPLREHIQQALSQHGLPIESDQVLLTQGASQGLDIVVRTLLRPGDAIAVEQPCYANFLQSLRQAGLTVLGVPRDGNGLCLDTLESLAREHKIKAMFVNTVLQNPTGTSLSMSNAFRLLQLAEQYDFRVIEDDVSRDLLPGLGPMLAALAGTGRVVYVSGFSKSIMPSMRVGYIVANDILLKEFAKTKMSMGLTTPELMERLVYQVLSQGRHQAHLLRVQDRLRQGHDELCALMDGHGFEILDRPQAGLFLWARPGSGQWREQGATRLAEKALEDGIWLAPGSYFDPDQRDTGWIRFNVAYSLHPQLWQFMRKTGAAAV
ncbi:PLP-dependent aminotransferase family protein [Pollutimonas harenae]|uniref:PLP-dependent aminotransferase family protein n=1 Tax=Pollutimonas harenae TaxID=657015 RepID=A0A853H3W3_9BURK|nr:PLP-dependent aminotransferase family protein [Pollutimonas harenae]NYT86912.1 PLP-dependent aminotransferase family protein [Pollutimonas harenae]TEA69374.1 PLP-dependent aminotransferase family protein [Pollutimonas harenae]